MFFDFLFGKKPPTPETTPSQQNHGTRGSVAPGTHIAYSPELVAELKQEHQQLLECFTRIVTAFGAGDLAETCREMDGFRGGLLTHLLKENVRFYIYLEHALVNDPSSHALVHQFRHEMDGIGKAVIAFLTKYADLAKNPELAKSFGADLETVGGVLVQRIRNEEENLYPLYLPAY